MHVCHVVLSLEPGGLENGVVNVANGLNRGEFRSSVCCLRCTGEFADRLRSDVRVMTMHLPARARPLAVLHLARELRRSRVDIVHTRNLPALLYGLPAARIGGVPAVIHSEHGRAVPELRRRAFVQRLLLRGADAAFAVSAQLRGDLARELQLAEGRFEVIYNGVDVKTFHPTEPGAGPENRPGRTLRIGSVGRLVPVKNYPLLFNACARLPREPAWELMLVGDGPARPDLMRLADDLRISDRVQFAGFRDDIPSVLRGLDIFVLPSFSEGLSNTLLEAMAAAVPVLASDAGGNREIIEPERSGLLFRSGDTEQAAAQLLRLVQSASLRNDLGSAGAARVRGEFSIEAMLRRYEALYRRVWEAKTRTPTLLLDAE